MNNVECTAIVYVLSLFAHEIFNIVCQYENKLEWSWRLHKLYVWFITSAGTETL
jgi:hypothetical protein